MKNCIARVISTLALLATLSTINSHLSTLYAQGTAFTYQGRLDSGGSPANGSYDLRFIVYDNSSGGNQQGQTLTNSATAVSNGLFTVTLDFGNVFPGAARWLDIAVRTNGTGSFTDLTTRQPLTPAPYAITAGNVISGGLAAGSYSNALILNNAANQFTGNGSGLANVNAATLGGLASSNFWQLGGNTVSAGQFLGSANNQPVAIRANNLQVMQFVYGSNSVDGYSPNVIGGNSGNNVAAGVVGATIGGGGQSGSFNSVAADFGTVVGGVSSSANGRYAVAGGYYSGANADYSVAMGNSFAGGVYSTAFGYSSATNGYSSALGYSFAYGQLSAAMGHSIASGQYSTALGNSTASGPYAAAIGYNSTASGADSTAMGNSTASGTNSTALGQSTATNTDATAAGLSFAHGQYSTAMGFSGASGNYSTALGWSGAGGDYSTASGNSSAGAFGATAMGYISQAAAVGATAMGDGSVADGFAAIAMGSSHAHGDYSIAMGNNSIASGTNSVAIGDNCSATNNFSTAIGYQSNAGGEGAMALGNSTATGPYSTAMGSSGTGGTFATAMGAATANGDYSTAIGGSLFGGPTEAEGASSFAAGAASLAANDFTFVWSDGSLPAYTSFTSTAVNQFLIHAGGGVGIGTNAPSASLHVVSSSGSPQVQITQQNSSDYTRLRMNVGGYQSWEMDVSPGSAPQLQFWNSTERAYIDYNGNLYAASFNNTSDRNAKENFSAVSPREVLDKIAALPITRWNFKNDKAIEHLGPMAQDFHAAFGLGTDDKHIATVDEEGVALAAIQGLNQKVEMENGALRAENAELKARLQKIEQLIYSEKGNAK